MKVKINAADMRRVSFLMGQLKGITRDNGKLDYLINAAGLDMVRIMKKNPPIGAPVDTANLKNMIMYEASLKQVESKAPYSQAVEETTSSATGKLKRVKKNAYAFFWKNIDIGLIKLKMNLNNTIKRSLR